MKEALESVMKGMGMSNSSNKLEPVHCEKCGNEIERIQIQHPFGKGTRWVPVACPCVIKEREDFNKEQERRLKQHKIEKALKLSSALEDIRNMTFSNYILRDGAENSYKEIKKAIENFEERGRLGVFIFGETGNGKSHLTAAGGNELIVKGYSVIFLTEKDLLSRLAATKNFRNEESFHEIMDACLRADLLVWDDFMSSQRLTDEEKDWIFQIFNGRERADKPIWATSNITPEEFQSDAIAYKLDDKGRTWWRIIGNMECIYNRAGNYRKSKAMARAIGITVEEYEKQRKSVEE
ncbi:ATP-binding protein [Sutcliffiella halmapala]|uniref:ATP-binding protein n=1 Tax=Sutcliffiella halmapala TaxID=79882 RepID=UPI001F463D8E|nr:ATP-binding protein [Sutcliffiella halmapala]